MKKRIYIIAEAGVNHNGSLELARKLIDAAVVAGADAVKFQTFLADELVSPSAPKAEYQQKTTDGAESQWQMLKKLELDQSGHQELFTYCNQKRIDFLSTPFDFQSLHFLEKNFNLPYLKVSSGDLTNGSFLLAMAQTDKKIILSTGMSTLGEIEQALGILAFGFLKLDKHPSYQTFLEAYNSQEGQRILQEKVTLLHCTTEYPAPIGDINLMAMDTLRQAFNLQVGYSDHTKGIAIPIAAAARGAAVIEKHFTLDRNLPGPDHQASLEPAELQMMVQAIRDVEKALGNGLKCPSPAEIRNQGAARKSLAARKPIPAGEVFSSENITSKRPGTGVSPLFYWDIIGKRAKRDYEKDELIDDE